MVWKKKIELINLCHSCIILTSCTCLICLAWKVCMMDSHFLRRLILETWFLSAVHIQKGIKMTWKVCTEWPIGAYPPSYSLTQNLKRKAGMFLMSPRRITSLIWASATWRWRIEDFICVELQWEGLHMRYTYFTSSVKCSFKLLVRIWYYECFYGENKNDSIDVSLGPKAWVTHPEIQRGSCVSIYQKIHSLTLLDLVLRLYFSHSVPSAVVKFSMDAMTFW